MQPHTLIPIQLFVLSKQRRIGREKEARDTLYTAYTLGWYVASPHRCGTFLVLQKSFIKLIELSFPIGLKDLTYIFVIFVVQMEAAEVN